MSTPLLSVCLYSSVLLLMSGWMDATKHTSTFLCTCLLVAGSLERPGVCTVTKVAVFVHCPSQTLSVEMDPSGSRLLAQVPLYKCTLASARLCVPQVADFAYPARMSFRASLEHLVLPSACPRALPSHRDHKRRVQNRYEQCAADGHPC